MSEDANETNETNETKKPDFPVVKPKKKPAKESEIAKPSVDESKSVKEESVSPSPRKSIYWPSVLSFAKKEPVAEAIKAACERLGVTEPLEISVPTESFGSMRDVMEALAMLDSTNADTDDLVGLGACLHALSI